MKAIKCNWNFLSLSRYNLFSWLHKMCIIFHTDTLGYDYFAMLFFYMSSEMWLEPWMQWFSLMITSHCDLLTFWDKQICFIREVSRVVYVKLKNRRSWFLVYRLPKSTYFFVLGFSFLFFFLFIFGSVAHRLAWVFPTWVGRAQFFVLHIRDCAYHHAMRPEITSSLVNMILFIPIKQ